MIMTILAILVIATCLTVAFQMGRPPRCEWVVGMDFGIPEVTTIYMCRTHRCLDTEPHRLCAVADPNRNAR